MTGSEPHLMKTKMKPNRYLAKKACSFIAAILYVLEYNESIMNNLSTSIFQE